jgi:c-di-GMP-binding flagellar brake protein YcgR
MIKGNIKMGDRVEIMPRDNKPGKSYASKVEQVVDDNTVELHVPISYGYLVKLPLDTPYAFLFYLDNGMMRAEAEIESYFTEDGFQMMRVRLITETKKYQRREYFRFECSIGLQFGVLPDHYDIARDIPKPEMFSAIARDISAGGACIVSNHDVEVKSRVKCIIPLGGDDFITFGKILHCHTMRNMPYRYEYRVLFVDLTASEKERIVKYIFTEQRKALRRGRRI